MRLIKKEAVADREKLRLMVAELKSKLDDADMREQKLTIANKNMMIAVRQADDEMTELKFKIKVMLTLLSAWNKP